MDESFSAYQLSASQQEFYSSRKSSIHAGVHEEDSKIAPNLVCTAVLKTSGAGENIVSSQFLSSQIWVCWWSYQIVVSLPLLPQITPKWLHNATFRPSGFRLRPLGFNVSPFGLQTNTKLTQRNWQNWKVVRVCQTFTTFQFACRSPKGETLHVLPFGLL